MEIIPQMLEFVHDIPVKHYCGKYGWFQKKTGETGVFFCGQASCGREYCQKLYYIKRVRLVSDLIREHTLSRFFTLTTTRDKPVKAAWADFPHVWHKVLTILKRKYPTLKHATILEAHKDGFPHAHMFANMYLDKFMLSRHMSNCGGGGYTYAEKIEVQDGEIGEYVSKQLNIARYVGKEQVVTARHMLKPRARSFYRSKGMKTKYELERASRSKSDWVMVPERMWSETKEGFDKRHGVVYNESIDGYLLVRNMSEEKES